MSLVKRYFLILALVFGVLDAEAAWYWPFGSSDDEALPTPAELMEPASRYIDAASDYADDGKIEEAVGEYRKALDELLRIEIENPDRVKLPEFATIRNKRAYIESAIDSLLLYQARSHARAVTVTDTTELERRYAEEQRLKAERQANRNKTSSDRGREPKAAEEPAEKPAAPEKPAAVEKPAAPEKPAARELPAETRERLAVAREDYLKKDYASALAVVKTVLEKEPNHAAALNLRAMIEKEKGDVRAAEATLEQLIKTNPKAVYGYYNLAKLILATRGEAGKETARYYYDTGRRTYGGPEDRYLEERLK